MRINGDDGVTVSPQRCSRPSSSLTAMSVVIKIGSNVATDESGAMRDDVVESIVNRPPSCTRPARTS